MKINLYSVEQNIPPIGEYVFIWRVSASGDIEEPIITEVVISICPEEELHLLPDGCHPRLAWRCSDMYYHDIWSYCCISRGE